MFALLLLGFLLASSVAAVAEVSASAGAAIQSSVRSEQAGKLYALQTGEPAAREALASVPGVVAVRDTSALAAVQGLQIPLLVRSTSQSALPVGELIEGRRASGDSEATVSRAVRDALGVDLGSTIEVRARSGASSSVLVVGTTVNTADADERTMTTRNVGLTARDTTLWLTDEDPSRIAKLQPLLERRVITVQSVQTLAEARSLTLPAGLAQFKHVPLGLGVILLVIAAAATSAFYPLARRDVASLGAAGVPARRAWRVIVGVASLWLVVGECVGAAAAVAGVHAAKEPLSLALGQYWVETTVPWRALVVLLLVSLVVPVLASPARSVALWLAGVVWSRARRAEGSPMRAILTLASGVVVVVVALIGRVHSPPSDLVRLGPLGVVLIAAGLPRAISPLTRRGVAPATGLFVRRISGGLMFVTASSLVLAVALAVHGATTTHDTRAFEAATRVPQPFGSLVITEIPAGAAETLLDEYAARGGSSTARYELADESRAALRVTSPGLVACLDDLGTKSPNDAPDECFPQGTQAPVNNVALAMQPGTTAIADPGLIEQGAVGLMLFKGFDGKVSRTDSSPAAPDEVLGGNLPGLVVPRDGDVARDFDLQGGGTQLVALLDYGELGAQDQSAIRAAVTRLAPAAQSVEATGYNSYEARRAVANLVTLSGSALVLVLVIVGGGAVALGNRGALRALVDMGSTMRSRRTMAVRWIALPVLSFLLGVPLAFVGASVSGLGVESSYGWVWVVPLLAGILGNLAVLPYLVRVHAHTAE